ASLEASPTVVPASTVPCRWIAPVRAMIASRSVVLPLWNGPTSAMHRGPVALVPPLPFAAAIDASLWRRPAGVVRPRIVTPECHGLRGMWPWQEEQSRQIVSNRGGRVRDIGAPLSSLPCKHRHDIAGETTQLFLVAVHGQQNVFDPRLAV